MILRCSFESDILFLTKDTLHYTEIELLVTLLGLSVPVLHPHTEAEFLIWASEKTSLRESQNISNNRSCLFILPDLGKSVRLR